MPRHLVYVIALGCAVAASVGRLAAAPTSERPAAARPIPAMTPAPPGASVTRPRIPLRFEPFETADNGTRTFTARTAGYTVRVAPTWAEIRPTPPAHGRPVRAVTLQFDGAAPGPREVCLEGASSTVNYVVGADAAGWRTGLEARGRVRFAEVYPGIDVAYYGTDADVEYDVVVAPGADPARVRLRLSGAGRVAISDDGDLELGTSDVPVRLRAPFAYQMDGTRRTAVGSRYALHADGTVGFALAAYDRGKPLVIDPILSYARLLGGSGLDEAVSVAVDATGNVYLAGTTSSAGFGGAPGGPAGLDVFVTKLDPRGSTVLYSTYVGGSGVDEAHAMTLDALGNVYVVGSTTSPNFPTVSPRQGALAGAADGFLFRLSTTGGGLGYSTYFGASDNDEINAIAIDGSRNMYVAGTTRSADFPLLNAAQAYGGALDGFVARFSAAGALTYSTYHGGSGVDTLEGIGVDASGNVNVVGSTTSHNLPVLNAQRPALAGGIDAFFSRFSPGGALLFCTYFGGTGNDVARAVATDPAGWSFIGGSTASPDFPLAGPLQPTFGGGLDAFLVAISPTGVVAWSTFYGGSRSERGRALALNPSGKLIYAGQTFSPDMPVVLPAQTRTGGNRDTFILELDPPYTSITYATYLGGSDNDEGAGVAVDRVGRVFTAGTADYASDTGAGGASDAFVYGLSSGLAGADTDGDGLPDDWETQFGLDPLTNDAAADPDGDGVTNAQEYANHTHPTGYFTRYLAEGSTGAFFDDRMALFNPNDDIATVVLRFQRDTGAEIQQTLSLPAHSRQTVNPELIAGLEAVAFSTAIESNQPVVVDRTMTWDSTGFGSHAETSIEQPSTQWFLAEGSTAGNFDLYYLLQNPNAVPAQVTITYLRPDGPPLTKAYTVNARSRRTINIDNEVGFTGRPPTEKSLRSADVSAQIVSNGVPILVERAMYMTAQGRVFAAGHDSAGVTAPAGSWFLAEGATGSFFDLFILLANPNTSPTTVEVTYLLLGGQPVVRQYALPAQSRRTIYVNAEPGLADVATSAVVRSLDAAVPIVVERSMWWPRGNWTEAHNSDGATLTSPKWALAEGEVGGVNSTTTYVLIANTSNFPATVTATAYFEDQGQPFVRTITVPANSRYNVDYAGTVAQGRRFAVMIEGTGPTPSQEPQLVVERAMYSNAGSVVWAAGTDALATPIFPPATFTATPNGVFPKVLVVDQGTRITIRNTDPDQTDTIDCVPGGHDISDDPHPTHGDDPEFGSGRLTFGQSRLTQNLVTPLAFGVHDHCHGSDPRYKARVIVRDTP